MDANIEFILNSTPDKSIESTLNIAIKNIDGLALTSILSLKEIYCSNGSACNSGSIKLSETIEELKLSKCYQNGVIRFGFGLENTIEEIDIVSREIINRVKRV